MTSTELVYAQILNIAVGLALTAVNSVTNVELLEQALELELEVL